MQSTAKSTQQQPQNAVQHRRRGGRNGSQPVYSESLAEEILDRLSEGESLESICSSPGMPVPSAVRKWARKDPLGFGAEYARARSFGHELMAEEIIVIGDNPCLFNGIPDNVLVQRARLMSENRKWLLSKLLPRQFGDKVTQELTSDPDRPMLTRIELVAVVPQHRLPLREPQDRLKPEDDGSSDG